MKKGIALILMVLIVWEVWGQETHTVKQLNITKSDGTTNSDGVSLFRADELVDRAKLRLRMGDEYTSEFEIGYRYYKDGEWYSNFSLSGYGVGYFRSKLGIGIHKPEAMLHVVGGDIDIGNTDGEHLLRFRRKEDGAPIGQVGLSETKNLKFAHYGGGGFFSFYTNSGGMSEKLRINNNGNVGIGTNSPEYKLHVKGSLYSESLFANTMKINHPNITSDWNSIWECGFFDAYNTSNAPEENRWFWGISIGHRSNRADYKYGGQIVIRNSPTTPRLYFRSRGKDGEGLWTQVLHGKGDQNIKGNLSVDGTIRTEEVKVTLLSASNMQLNGTLAANSITLNTNGHTADFVFEDNYPLKDLNQVEAFIKEHKHLPDIPSASEMEASGVNLAEMNKLLLRKIEELTLYVIEQDSHLEKKNEFVKEMSAEVKRQNIEIDQLQDINENLIERLERVENLLSNSGH